MWEDTKAVLPTLLPEIRDYEKDVMLRGLRNIWFRVVEGLHYYLDRKSQEVHLFTCKKFKSAVYIAEGVGYRVRGYFASMVLVTFTLSEEATQEVIIPAGTELRTDDDIRFFTKQSTSIPIGETEVSVEAENKILVSAVSAGAVTSNGFFIISERVVDGSVEMTIGSDEYFFQESLFESLPTQKHFVSSILDIDLDTGIAPTKVVWGDGVNGFAPTIGQPITTTYYITDGAKGNVAENSITNISDFISVQSGATLSVTNALSATGGKDYENLTELKRNIPKFINTLSNMVTEKGHADACELIAGVAKAGVQYAGGNIVDFFIVPSGGGLASDAFLTFVKARLDARKIICTTTRVQNAGEVRLKMSLDVEVESSENNLQKASEIREALVAFGSLANQEIGGSVGADDIYQLVRNLPRVKKARLYDFNAVPYARPVGTTIVLNWTPVIKPTSTAIVEWEVLFTGATTFQLIKNGMFVGNFNTGVLVVETEIDFTISGSYALNNRFTFKSYPYLGDRGGRIELAEPSIPVIKATDITLNVTGGLV
jgi:hypothetical protein